MNLVLTGIEDSLDGWARNTTSHLFDQADTSGFGLFFSFDHNHFANPADYTEFLKPYLNRTSYFQYNEKPLVSTFNGEDISDADWATFKKAVGDILLVPGFSRATPKLDFFTGRESLDGIFNWNSWPSPEAGKANVSDSDDATYLTAAHDQGKLFMMGISPLQFKHMDSGNNWYLRGEGNLENRLEQVLALQPDMIELQTWNDAGEGHYMGNWWEEPIQNTPIPDYVRGYDHTGYWKVLAPFIKAWKQGETTTAGMVPIGKTVQGAFWHHAVTVDADCETDPLGKPRDYQNAEDVVSGIVLVESSKKGLVAVVTNGRKELGRITLSGGYNQFKFEGLGVGRVKIDILDEAEKVVVSAIGDLEVLAFVPLCNYNFQVVGF